MSVDSSQRLSPSPQSAPEVRLAPVLSNPKRRARKAAHRARKAAHRAKHSRHAGEGSHTRYPVKDPFLHGSKPIPPTTGGSQ